MTLIDFLRSISSTDLNDYFQIRRISVPDDIPWEGLAHPRAEKLQAALDALGDVAIAQVANDAERVAQLSDETGQAAMESVFTPTGEWAAREGGRARALWLLLHHPSEFARAEEARFADDRRMGQRWDGFLTSKGVSVQRSPEAKECLRKAVAEHFGSKRAMVEICSRTRIEEDEARRLVQIAIYREGRAEYRRQFNGEQIEHVPDRPVVEATVTYEPDIGLIEAVAPTAEHRLKLAQMVCEHLLQQPLSGERFQLRRYNLDILRRPFEFPTDPTDHIERVQLKSLRLMPFDAPSERITLECMRGSKRDLWQLSAQQFGDSDPLLRGHRITRASFSVHFSLKGPNGKRTMPVTITMPAGCDVKDRTKREQLIGRKYLARWGIVAQT